MNTRLLYARFYKIGLYIKGTKMKKIIVGDDGSEFAGKALEKVIELAKKEDMFGRIKED